MTDFKKALNKKIKQSIYNNYGIENYDEYRFGKYPIDAVRSIPKTNLTSIKGSKKAIKKFIGYHHKEEAYFKQAKDFVDSKIANIDRIWDKLSKLDQKLFVDLIAYKIFGFSKVKLSRNNSDYWKALETAKCLSNTNDTHDPKFMHFILEKFDLSPLGYDVKFYFSEIGVAIDYIIEQYAYKIGKKTVVSATHGDTVLDVGGCWADTALYFAHKVGDTGKVFSFEFIPDNIKLFKINTSFNDVLSKRIRLIEQPISSKSGDTIYFKDNGPGSKVGFKPFEEQTGSCTSISIDDFVSNNAIQQVDFIKMDIEGAETLALQGAIKTIKKFRPKLAIAIYHSFDDFINIPNWILNLDLDYEIFLGHYTIHDEETICFAKPKDHKK